MNIAIPRHICIYDMKVFDIFINRLSFYFLYIMLQIDFIMQESTRSQMFCRIHLLKIFKKLT